MINQDFSEKLSFFPCKIQSFPKVIFKVYRINDTKITSDFQKYREMIVESRKFIHMTLFTTGLFPTLLNQKFSSAQIFASKNSNYATQQTHYFTFSHSLKDVQYYIIQLVIWL